MRDHPMKNPSRKYFEKNRYLISIFILTSFLGACTRQIAIPTTPAAPIPENVPFDNPYQRQLQSSAQWHVVAEDMAQQLKATIKSKNLSDRPFYIYAQNKPSSFNRAFNDFLITTLVKEGVKVSNEKQGSQVFNYKIQLIEYDAIRETVVAQNLKYTSLAAGFVVFRNLANLIGLDGTTLASGATLDAVDFNIAPNLEIIITSSIMDGHIYISRSTDIYYANKSDKDLYLPNRQPKASDAFNEPFYQLR